MYLNEILVCIHIILLTCNVLSFPYVFFTYSVNVMFEKPFCMRYIQGNMHTGMFSFLLYYQYLNGYILPMIKGNKLKRYVITKTQRNTNHVHCICLYDTIYGTVFEKKNTGRWSIFADISPLVLCWIIASTVPPNQYTHGLCFVEAGLPMFTWFT